MLSATDVHKEYDHHVVLAGVSVGVNPGERLAVVGANGSGKSTLLRVLAGRETPDQGRVTWDSRDEIGYLPQTVTGLGDATVEEVVADAVAGLRRIEDRMRHLEQRMAEDATPDVLEEYGDLSARFEARGGYELASNIGKVFAGLGISHIASARRAASLSGGEKSRVALAALLIQAPDLLLLDEPTNDLDDAALAWLQDYLAAYRGGVLYVSHDRDFIDVTCTAILELDEHAHTAARYEGNYQRYLDAKAAARARQQQAYDAQQEEIRQLKRHLASTARNVGHGNTRVRDNDKYVNSFKQGAVERAVSRNVRNAKERLERLEANLLSPPPEPLTFRAIIDAAALRPGDLAIDAVNVAVSYGDRRVLDGVSCTLRAGDHVCVTGPNGSGKSTLLRVLAGKTTPGSGTVNTRRGLRVGYLPQEPELPAPAKTVAQNIALALPDAGPGAQGWLIRWGLITRDDLTKRVADISIGQRRKVELGILIGSRPDALLLDEPTNHLSFDVIESLQRALVEFDGPVVIVTHDRRLIRSFPAGEWRLRDGQITETVGSV